MKRFFRHLRKALIVVGKTALAFFAQYYVGN